MSNVPAGPRELKPASWSGVFVIISGGYGIRTVAVGFAAAKSRTALASDCSMPNAGIVDPRGLGAATTPGTLGVQGSYTQTTTGSLRLQLFGAAAGRFDRVTVSGAARSRSSVTS